MTESERADEGLSTLVRIQPAGRHPSDRRMVNGYEAPAPRALDDKIVPLPSSNQLAAAAPDVRSRDRRNTFLHVTIPVSFFTAPSRPTSPHHHRNS
ncbi:MAG TPA: hypothetical protein DEA71_13180 [Nitrospira sp.]|nr:hypothetical protein [Nitrospira sp.]